MSVSALPHRDAVEYFESACEGVEVRAGGTEGEGLGALCSGLVLPHTAPLADFVFAGGAEGLASYLCQHLSRSCDPDLPHVKIRIHSEPNNGSATGSGHRGRVAVSDGTESTRSSFVLLGPDTCGDRSSSPPPSPSSPLPDIEDASPDRGPEEDEGRGSAETVAEEKLPRGFVNKCVTKVRSFMGRSGQERD